MYSSKENINILTSLLLEHGVLRAVVCPGSRNAPIVHNLNESRQIDCYPVTDERSAGFCALGMIQETDSPVAVCVTSGSALLNLAPAVAEAYYQKLPLVVIAADRPEAWIEQLDGQTLNQPMALSPFFLKIVSIREIHTDEDRWFVNRSCNEALLSCSSFGGGPVLINVPISKPLFGFTESVLPRQRKIVGISQKVDVEGIRDIAVRLVNAIRPMIIIGQLKGKESNEIREYLQKIRKRVVVIQECLSLPDEGWQVSDLDELVSVVQENEFLPDFILYVGNTLISNKFKEFIRKSNPLECWVVADDGQVHDVFMNQTGVISGNAVEVMQVFAEIIEEQSFKNKNRFFQRWFGALENHKEDSDFSMRNFDEKYIISSFFHYMRIFSRNDIRIQSGNSLSVRYVNLFSKTHVFCNRGVNGIEGSLSTAAGMSMVSSKLVFCIIGDLSFFYDQNALWNRSLKGNFRILLINNGRGAIFDNLPGLEVSPAKNNYIAASHHTDARGICMSNKIRYISISDKEELQVSLETFFAKDSDVPILLECFV